MRRYFSAPMADSTAVFAAAAAKAGLGELKELMDAKGWDTFNKFAFSTTAWGQPEATVFSEQVVIPLIGAEGAEGRGPKGHLLPALRRLFAQAYTFSAADMAKMTDPAASTSRPGLHPVDRDAGLNRIRKELSQEFDVRLENQPSDKLIDRYSVRPCPKNIF